MEMFSGNGLLFKFEGKVVGIDQIPREMFGVFGEKHVRFWISYLKPGELFFFKDSWYKVQVNDFHDLGHVQKYVFFAVPVSEVSAE